jgi:micrococcal nuclease
LIKKTSTPSKRERAAVQRIVDGDTIEILFRGAPDTVRLIGVDTPEKRDNEKARRDAARTGSDLKTIIAAGKGASAYLRSLIAPGAAIELEFDVRPRDKYGRLLAYVYRGDGVMLNEAMVLGGFASAYTVPPDVRYAERFRKAEAAARAGRQGLWR